MSYCADKVPYGQMNLIWKVEYYKQLSIQHPYESSLNCANPTPPLPNKKKKERKKATHIATSLVVPKLFFVKAFEQDLHIKLYFSFQDFVLKHQDLIMQFGSRADFALTITCNLARLAVIHSAFKVVFWTIRSYELIF